MRWLGTFALAVAINVVLDVVLSSRVVAEISDVPMSGDPISVLVRFTISLAVAFTIVFRNALKPR